MADYQKEEPKDLVRDESGKVKAFTQKPGVMDYFKEGFLPDNEKAQLNAIRNRRERAQGST